MSKFDKMIGVVLEGIGVRENKILTANTIEGLIERVALTLNDDLRQYQSTGGILGDDGGTQVSFEDINFNESQGTISVDGFKATTKVGFDSTNMDEAFHEDESALLMMAEDLLRLSSIKHAKSEATVEGDYVTTRQTDFDKSYTTEHVARDGDEYSVHVGALIRLVDSLKTPDYQLGQGVKEFRYALESE